MVTEAGTESVGRVDGTSTIRAGVDRVPISPDVGMYLIGFGDRAGGAESVHDDLTATTLVLDDGNEKAVIISLDLLFLHRETVDCVRSGITDRLGIPAKNVLLCCSHTHSGPVAWAPPRVGVYERLREMKHRIFALPVALERLKAYRAESANASASRGKNGAALFRALTQPKGVKSNRKYLDNLAKILVESVVSASSRMTECEITHGKGATDIGINRRERKPDGTIELGYNEEGPVDRDVDVLQIKRDDEPLVTLVNHACHVTILGPNSNRVSADMIGVMRAKVEKELGGLCMFVQGAAGNINPNVEWSDDNMPDARRFGEKLADAVLEAGKNMKKVSPTPLKGAEDVVDAYLDVPEAIKDWAVQKINRHMINKALGAPMFLIDPLFYIRFPWKAALKKSPDGYSTPIHIGALRLGDVAISWIAMEPFVETGCAVKAASSAPVTLFAGYTNGHNGYLPTAEESKLGGYEVEQAPYMMRLPGTIRTDTEARVAGRLEALLESVAPQEKAAGGKV